MGEFPGSIDCFVDRNRVFINRNDQATIVIHGTGGAANQTAVQLGQFFATTPAMTCVHYGVDRAGVIAQYCLEQDGACGNGILEAGHDPFWNQYSDNPNWHSLSVETINDSANSLPLTDPQKQTVFKLIKYWVDKYHIPIANIKSHASLDPINRSACPGPNFPWDELWSYLNGEEMMTINLNTPRVSDYFQATNDATVWKCKKTGFLIGHGILSFYQKFGGDALCGLTYLGLPQSPEVGAGNGRVYQRFERGVVAYDTRHTIDNPPGSGPVYMMYIDSGLGQDPRIAQLQAEITQLQQSISAPAPALQTLPTTQSLSAPTVQISPTTQLPSAPTNQSQQT